MLPDAFSTRVFRAKPGPGTGNLPAAVNGLIFPFGDTICQGQFKSIYSFHGTEPQTGHPGLQLRSAAPGSPPHLQLL